MGQAPAGRSTAAAAEVKKEERVRFYGFTLDYSIYDGSGLNGVNYSNSIDQYFMPSWNFGKLWFKGTRWERLGLGARFVLSHALAGYDDTAQSQFSDNGYAVRCSTIVPSSNGGTVDPSQVKRCEYGHNYRWDYGDILLTLRAPRIYTIPKALIHLNAAIAGTIPTSLESRYQTLRFALTPSLGVNRSFLSDKITVGYSFAFTKYFQDFTTPGLSKDGAALNNDLGLQGYGNVDISSNMVSYLADPSHEGTLGQRNANYGFRHIFSFDYAPLEKLTFSLIYILTDAFAYGVPCVLPTYGNVGNVDTCTNGDKVAANSGTNVLQVAHRDSQWFWATAGYQALDWLNVSIALITISPQRHPDGSLRQPFLSTDYAAYSTVSAGVTVSLDKAAAKIWK